MPVTWSLKASLNWLKWIKHSNAPPCDRQRDGISRFFFSCTQNHTQMYYELSSVKYNTCAHRVTFTYSNTTVLFVVFMKRGNPGLQGWPFVSPPAKTKPPCGLRFLTGGAWTFALVRLRWIKLTKMLQQLCYLWSAQDSPWKSVILSETQKDQWEIVTSES